MRDDLSLIYADSELFVSEKSAFRRLHFDREELSFVYAACKYFFTQSNHNSHGRMSTVPLT